VAKRSLVATRLTREQVAELERIAEEEKADKATVLRKMLDLGLKQWKLQRAVELYRKGKATMWKAADTAGISLWEMIDAIAKEKVPVQYSLENLREDLEDIYGR
jgi:predicted HTH domain antitoxin